MTRATKQRLEIIEALAEMENVDRDTAINQAMCEWALERVEDHLVEHVERIFRDE